MSDTPRRKQGVPTLTSVGYAGGLPGGAGNSGKRDPREAGVSPATVQGFAPLSAEDDEAAPPPRRTPPDGTRPLPMMESLRIRNPTETPLERPRIQMPPAEPRSRPTPAEFGPNASPRGGQQVAATQVNPRTFLHGRLDRPAQTAIMGSPIVPVARPAPTAPSPVLPPAAVSAPQATPPLGRQAPVLPGTRTVPGAKASRAQAPLSPDEVKTTIFQRSDLIDASDVHQLSPLRRLQRWWFLLPVAPLTFVFAYLVFGAPEPEPRPLGTAAVTSTAALPADRSAVVERGSIEVSVRAEGRVLGGVGTEIRPEAEGSVAAVHVKEGQSVKEGQPLLTFDGASLRKQLRAANQVIADRKAELTVLRLRRDAVRRDMNSGLLWPAEMEAAEAELIRGEARLKAAMNSRRRLEERGRAGSLTAPTAGVVRDLTVKVGQRLEPDDDQRTPALMIIEEPGKLAIEADLGPELAAKVTVGSRARVTLGDGSQKTLEGSITALPEGVVKTAAGTEIRRAELLVDAGPGADDVAPGTSASIRLVGEKKQGVLLVPAAAITTDNAGATVEVWSAAEQHYERRVVQTGASDDTHVEILNNLAAGDRVRLAGKI